MYGNKDIQQFCTNNPIPPFPKPYVWTCTASILTIGIYSVQYRNVCMYLIRAAYLLVQHLIYHSIQSIQSLSTSMILSRNVNY